MATELSANNPDLIESIRRNMGNRPDSNRNNNERTGLLKKLNSIKNSFLHLRSKQSTIVIRHK